MCGGGAVGGGGDKQESYVDRLTRTIEANLANNNAGVRSGSSLYDDRAPAFRSEASSGGGGYPTGGGPDRDRQGSGSSGGGGSVGGGGGNSDNIRDSGRSYDYVSTPAPRTPQVPAGRVSGAVENNPVSPAAWAKDPGFYSGMSYPELMNVKMTPKGQAGVLGTFSYESGGGLGGLNPAAINWIGATGLAQNLGPRKEALLDRFGIPRDATDKEISEALKGTTYGQLGFSLNEMMTEPAYEKSKKAVTEGDNLADITKTLTQNFERPSKLEQIMSEDDRLKSAQAFYDGSAGADISFGKQQNVFDRIIDKFTNNNPQGVQYTGPGYSPFNETIKSDYGPNGDLTREQYREQYGNGGGADRPQKKKAAIEPVAPVATTTPAAIPTIVPQSTTTPVAPGTTPNTRKLSDEEYAALSPLEKAYYDMGISTYGTFTPEYNYFPNRQPILLREPVIAPDEKNKKRNGGLVKGPGTETSDSVPALIGGKTPAALSDGEFVFTGRAVRGMGNGDRMEGARKLHQMMKKAEGNASKGGPRK